MTACYVLIRTTNTIDMSQLLCATCVGALAASTSPTSDWRRSLDVELRQVNSALASVQWQLATSTPTPTLALAAQRLGAAASAWRNEWCDALEGEEGDTREASLMCRGPKYTRALAEATSSVLGDLSARYAAGRVCAGATCLRGEPDLERVMRTSRDPDTLMWAWLGWRDAVGPAARAPYMRLVALQNQAARNNGYEDMGECWRAELDTPDLERVVERLYDEVRPLYELLHAVVRHRLVALYGPRLVDPRGPIPAHLLGNMWAQNWASLLDLVMPAEASPQNQDQHVPSKDQDQDLHQHVASQDQDLTAALRRRNNTVVTMLKHAEDLYTSLRLPAMTPTFWAKSRVEAPRENASCHGTAANMFRSGDYRMLLCGEVNEEDFAVVHHEMGHIQYYMAYADQPTIFQDGANSAFQEAVGDAITYAAMTPQHLQRLGLVDDISQDRAGLRSLLRLALAKLPELPFQLLVDKWRWYMFAGADQPNALWWRLRRRYQGVAPPVPRSEHDFDAASKFHVPDNTPYVRYFLGSVLQVQMFKALCQAAVTGHVDPAAPAPLPLHTCDIYGSQLAGHRLKLMMRLGASVSWREALRTLTNATDYDTAPLRELYAPLERWLRAQIARHGIPVGWGTA